jgi:hypothetical protein
LKCAVLRTIQLNKAKAIKKAPCMCMFCGGVSLKTAYESHGKMNFCDGECYMDFRKAGFAFTRRMEFSSNTNLTSSCLFCGGGMVCTDRDYCSESCQNKHRQQSYRILKKINGPIEPISLSVLAAESDWTCVSCGCKCTKGNGLNKPTDATIDHVIPVSKGGTHTRSNVQLMCRRCNTDKGDYLATGTQLVLALVD